MSNRIILFSVFSPSRDSILFESQEGEEPVTDRLRGASVTVLPPRPPGPESRVEREGKTESRTLEKEELLFTQRKLEGRSYNRIYVKYRIFGLLITTSFLNERRSYR